MAGQGAISNSLLDRVSNVVRSEEDHPSFQGTWMVVATWNGSVQFGGSGALVSLEQTIIRQKYSGTPLFRTLQKSLKCTGSVILYTSLCSWDHAQYPDLGRCPHFMDVRGIPL